MTLTLGVKLRVFTACILSAFAGSQLVHVIYKPDMGVLSTQPQQTAPDSGSLQTKATN